MAISVQARGGRFQLRVTHALLPKPFFFTFDDDTEARTYGAQLRDLLDRGIVPAELLAPARGADDPLLVEVVRAYTKGAPITNSDDALLGTMLEELVGVRVSGVTFAWADNYVLKLKTVRNVAPGTIRKRVGALARVLDWHYRRTTPQDKTPPANAMRLLPKGYSNYSRADIDALKDGAVPRRDETRDLRLTPEQEQDVIAALAGVKRPDRERALTVDPELDLLFHLVLDTGLRLREAYRLRVEQIDLAKRVIHVDGTKGHRGKIKPRMVPIKADLLKRLTAWLKGRIGRVFPSLWDGDNDEKALARTSMRLSSRFTTLFAYAGVDGFTEHDLRHEATCRWVEMRNARGWVFSDVEIARIMGWSSLSMLLRYASLRGEDLAARMAG